MFCPSIASVKVPVTLKGLSNPLLRMDNNVYLKYRIKDQNTLDMYTGMVEIGKICQDAKITEHDITTRVASWITASCLHPGSLPLYTHVWNIPIGQDLVDFNFSSPFTVINVAKNLQLPVYKAYVGYFIRGDQEIIIIPVIVLNKKNYMEPSTIVELALSEHYAQVLPVLLKNSISMSQRIMRRQFGVGNI
jgi:hypothetical protein